MSAKIPVTIVTGFLGAGKTTMIRHWLENANGRRIALLINEFGDVGVDGEILKSCGVEACREEDIVELANGCICCTVADDFLPAMEMLLKRADRLDHIVIETSGLALPKPLLKAFDWPQVRAKVTVDGVIAVVDASAVAEGRFADDVAAMTPGVDHDNPLEEVYEDQLLCADMVVLNKTDLLSTADAARVAQEVRGAARGIAKVLAAREGRVDPDIALGLKAGAEDDVAARPSHHDAEEEHDHEDFESFVFPAPALADPEAFVEKLAAVARAHDVLRVKGFLDVTGKPMRLLVQGVGARFRREFDRPWRADEPRAGRLVVIGRKGFDRAAIERALA